MDMVWLVFWTYNCTLLLHYFQTDTVLAQSEAACEHQTLLTDLINEIYVFIIRDTERRVDKVLDAAMLEHDSLPLSDIKFEGDWNFMKSLAGSVKSMSSSSTANQSSPQRRPLSQIFSSSGSVTGSPKINNTPGSNGLATPPPQKGSSSPHKRAPSELNLVSIRETSATASASDLLARPSPRTITALLTSTLQVLQLFEVNPAIIVQALSQVLFWIGCELFNRVLGNKKYLCRSKAMQIRLNVSALEDWARNNALPLSIVHQHLAPLSQMVSWLQCQSALSDFDGLITTLQGLKALNPLQLRKAVRDYRYEINESRMSEECLQYLLQLHEDWDRSVEQHLLRQLQQPPTSHSRDRTATQQDPHGADSEPISSQEMHLNDVTLRSSPEALDLSEEEKASRHAQMAIDSLFEPGNSMADYMPPWTPLGRPGPNGELVATADKVNPKSAIVRDLLNSREMLPFALPTASSALTVSPGDTFNFGRGHFNGTGTPSLKSLHALSPRFPLSHESLHSKLTRLSGPSSVSSGRRGEDDSDSVISATTGSSASSRQSLFSTGHGFGAGSSWRAVPLLPEGILETIDAFCRSQRPAVESRLSSFAAWDSPKISITTSPTAARHSTMSPKLGESGDVERSTDSSGTAKYGQLGSGWEESSAKPLGHTRQASTFSAKPLRLAIPDRTRRSNSCHGTADDDEDAAVTPVRTNLQASPERIAV